MYICVCPSTIQDYVIVFIHYDIVGTSTMYFFNIC